MSTWDGLAKTALDIGLTSLSAALLPGGPVVGRALKQAAVQSVAQVVAQKLGAVDEHENQIRPAVVNAPKQQVVDVLHEVDAETAYAVLEPQPNFSLKEMQCHYSKRLDPPDVAYFNEGLRRLQMLRDKVGIPLKVNSGWRCLRHPAERNKPKGASHQHYHFAVDLGVYHGDALDVLAAALTMDDQPFRGIGISQKGAPGQRFIHLDTRKVPAFWSY